MERGNGNPGAVIADDSFPNLGAARDRHSCGCPGNSIREVDRASVPGIYVWCTEFVVLALSDPLPFIADLNLVRNYRKKKL